MDSRIELTESEVQRMRRILASANLPTQRNMSIPFFVIAVAIAVGFPAVKGFEPEAIILAMPYALMSLFIGLAQLGHYRLFRIIHHLGKERNSDQTE